MMESTDLIKRIAQGDMTEDEQLALLAQVEASIQLRKQAKAAEQELSAFDKAAEVIAQTINEHKQQVNQALDEIRYYVRQPGPPGKDGKGIKGDKGDKGDSIVGPQGPKGDSIEGPPGKDGVSIVDVYWAADGSLVCVLSDGREIDTGPLIGGTGDGSTNVSVSQWAGYSSEELKQTLVGKTFETVNKNLEASGGALAYNANDDLISITYDNGIVKTLDYSVDGDLTSVTLSGNTPQGIDLVKTFSYDAYANLVSFAYS